MSDRSDIVRMRIRVEGRVQGVNFRASAKREADRFGLSGFARNESDGSVSIEVEGREEDVSAFRRWAEAGPSRAEVAHIGSVPISPVGGHDFHVG
ncbi:MAG: acylphosphatase [Candidatus Moranbacteria bacterium]|nr:acylphosphatase [Candidatus Moranbacteria bacterium]